METTLHRQLKDRYGTAVGGRLEVAAEGFRADAIGSDGVWIEVQSGPLGPLRPKLERILPRRRVRVIKPVVLERRVVRRGRPDGPDLSARRSPRRGRLTDVFADLVGLALLVPHPQLELEVLGVAIDEVRVPRRRRPGFAVVDRSLREVLTTVPVAGAPDLWGLLPPTLPDPFSTRDLAERLAVPRVLAERVAYCLRVSGAATPCGKVGNRILYSPGTGVLPDRLDPLLL